MQTVRQWLEQLGLPQYAEVFANNDVDLEALRLLGESDLEKLGVSLGNRKKLLKAIAELNGTTAPVAASQTLRSQVPSHETSAEAERRQLTVMFCDLAGSTQLASTLDPEQLRDLMQAYQRACREVMERYEGHIAQYLGDGLMIYFGWPRAHEDDAVRAIRAGLEVTQAVSQLKTSTPISARVGIHTGLVVVGETGQGDASIPKAAVGETPNIAARLQGLAAPGSVMVSERTRGLAGGLFDYADLGTPALKGVSQSLRVFCATGSRAVESRFEAARGDAKLTPLVGREEEIALLLRRWQDAKGGEGQVVQVGGEPGIGKSRLTRLLRERIQGTPYTPLRYQCSPYHVNSALYPIIEQFERAAGFARGDTPELKLDKLQVVLAGGEAKVAKITPLFAAMLSLPVDRYPALELSPQKQKENTLEALAGQVEALAKRRPVLMIWEDVHWIDATSQEFLDLLVPRLQRLPILLVVTNRPEYTPRWTEQAHVTILSLTRLGRRQGAELVAKLTCGKALPPEVLEQILAHTDGVPLFVEELTKSILESSLVREQADGYVLDGPLPALAIPTTLRDSLIARLDRLAPVREVAQIGACIGREFPYDLLSAVSPLKGAKLDEALEQLSASGLLFRQGAPPDATYTFKHALVQDAAYDSLLKSRRKELHAKIAREIEVHLPLSRDSAPEVLAHHLTEAGLFKPAVDYWQQAAKRAISRSAVLEAAAHASRGLQVLSTLPESPDRVRQELGLQLALGYASALRKGWTAREAERAFSRARGLCEVVGDTPEAFAALWGVGAALCVRGRMQDAREVTEDFLARAQRLGDTGATVEGNRIVGEMAFRLGDPERSRTHLEEGLRLYDPVAHRSNIVLYGQDSGMASLGRLGAVRWLLGYPDRALQAVGDAIALAEHIAHPFSVALAHFHASQLRLCRREWEAARRSVETALAISSEHGFHYVAMEARATSSILDTFQRKREAIFVARTEISALLSIGAEEHAPKKLGQLADACRALGQVDDARAMLADALALVDKNNDCSWEGELHRVKAELLREGGQAVEAEASMQRALQVAQHQKARSLELRATVSLARLWRDQGDDQKAYGLLAPIYNWFTEGFDTTDLKEAKALLNDLS